ncbi:GNAT family N-acetyltransferase [Hoeflea prorocentri]|uniref:GNAT family N-acetyltransferase n=1 Tax=Hoeflea prorocentri TaxID=1922333 RepID=A0A9X3ULV2_9HYPH|nr:GNAT family N-acetyltransferase [Hoeflea prorocentri]MCY6382946.1 GNAT family N-acetyltransferase [Hoeflea prorocentri]MDA5400746.1 GNAT family N-acetyltransferase [Hoeflea prorocentri]
MPSRNTAFNLRKAAVEDATALAQLVNIAGEGLPLVLWTSMAKADEDPWDLGASRARRTEGSFSWTNARIADIDGTVAGAIITYLTAPQPEPINDDTPEMFRPLIALENDVPETNYINVLAVFPQFRRMGIASALLESATANPGKNGASIIVADQNTGARRLYARHGFTEVARELIVKGDWRTKNREWILLKKAG